MVVGVAWGTLSAAKQMRWTRLGCDMLLQSPFEADVAATGAVSEVFLQRYRSNHRTALAGREAGESCTFGTLPPALRLLSSPPTPRALSTSPEDTPSYKPERDCGGGGGERGQPRSVVELVSGVLSHALRRVNRRVRRAAASHRAGWTTSLSSASSSPRSFGPSAGPLPRHRLCGGHSFAGAFPEPASRSAAAWRLRRQLELRVYIAYDVGDAFFDSRATEAAARVWLEARATQPCCVL